MAEPLQTYEAPAPAAGMKSAIVAGAIVALLASNVYLYLQLDKVRTDMTKTKESLMTEITNLRETSSVTSATNRHHLDTLKDELETARRHATMAASQAKSEALTHAEQLAKKLEEEQQQQQQRVATELTDVKQAATTANAKIADVNGQVGAVKSQVEMTRSELEKTIGDLKKVSGDLGVTSGYVATNQKELSALKRLNERNYFEFKLGKSKKPQRVGDVTLLLKKADPKHNKYTLEVVADDKVTEKKDRNINEPLQFYVAKARQPYEIVVNEVKKDQVAGYLATPKDQVARN